MENPRAATRAVLRLLAVSAAIGTLLFLALAFDLVAQPPDTGAAGDFLSQLEAEIPYQQARWPFTLLAGAAFIVTFVSIAILGSLMALLVEGRNALRAVAASTLLAGGVLGAAGNLVSLGAERATVGVPYCDCLLKTEELVSRFYALNLIEGSATWLGHAALILAAIGLVAVAGLVGRRVGETWRTVSWVAAVLLIASVVLRETIPAIYGDMLLAGTTLLVIPAWALWLASRLPAAEPPEERSPAAAPAP